MKKNSLLFVLVLLIGSATSTYATDKTTKVEDTSVKKERNFIRSGNKLYKEKRYAEAEVEYKKALQINPNSEVATYNLSTVLIRQGGGVNKDDAKKDQNDPITQAQKMLDNLVRTSNNNNLTAKAFYNLGNIEYNREQYQAAIDHYKNSLRRNPDDDQARENLRLAQLKQQQQNQDKSQDKNQEQQQQQQQQQQQNQQNQDKEKKDESGGISQDNVEQILKSLQNQENAIQQKMNAGHDKEKNSSRRRTGNQW